MENNMINSKILKVRALRDSFLMGFKFVNPIVDSSVDGDLKILMKREESRVTPGVSVLRITAGGIKSSITITDIETISIEGDACLYVDGKELINNLEKSPNGEVILELDFEQEKIKITCEGNYMEIACDIVKQFDPSEEISEKEAALRRYRVSVVEELRRHSGSMNFIGEFALNQKNFVDIIKGLEKTPCIIDKEKYIRLRVFKERRVEQVIDPKTKQPIQDENGNIKVVENIYDVVEGVSGDGDRVARIIRDGYSVNGYQAKMVPTINELSFFVNLKVAGNVVSAINNIKNISLMKSEPIIIRKTESAMYLNIGTARFVCEVQNLNANYDLQMFNSQAVWKSRVDLADFKRTIDLLNDFLDKNNKISSLQVDNITKIVPEESALRFEGMSHSGLNTSLKQEYRMCQGYQDFAPGVNAKIKLPRKYMREAIASIESKKGKEVELGIHAYNLKTIYQKDEQGNFVRDEQGQPKTIQVPEMLLSISDGTLGQYGVTQRIRVEAVN